MVGIHTAVQISKAAVNYFFCASEALRFLLAAGEGGGGICTWTMFLDSCARNDWQYVNIGDAVYFQMHEMHMTRRSRRR